MVAKEAKKAKKISEPEMRLSAEQPRQLQHAHHKRAETASHAWRKIDSFEAVQPVRRMANRSKEISGLYVSANDTEYATFKAGVQSEFEPAAYMSHRESL